MLGRRAQIGLELAIHRGILEVTSVEPDGPAGRAGVRPTDRLLAVDGRPIADLIAVRRAVGVLSTARRSVLSLLRGDQPLALEVQPMVTPLEHIAHGHVELGELQWRAYRLRTLWTWPRTRGPHPVVWLLPGASWLSEEHPQSPDYPTLKLVDFLTGAGFATLRIERSGVGDSEGPPCTELDLHDELEAFRLGFDYIRAEPRVLRARLFVFGRSLGGMLAPLVARGRELAGLAVWGTSCASWHDALLRSTLRQFRLAGRSGRALEQLAEQLSDLQSLVYLDGLTPDEAYTRRPDLRAVLPSVYRGRHVYDRVCTYLQQLQAEDVREAFRTVGAPVLALHGSCDWMSELSDLEQIAALHPARNRCIEIEGLDHLMHERESLTAAFAEPFGGSFSDEAGKHMAAFFQGC